MVQESDYKNNNRPRVGRRTTFDQELTLAGLSIPVAGQSQPVMEVLTAILAIKLCDIGSDKRRYGRFHNFV